MKKNQKGFSIVEMLIVIVIIGLIATLGWLFFNKQKDANNNDGGQPGSSKTETKSETALQPKDITSKIVSNYEAQYKLLDIEQNNQPKQGEMSILLSNRAPVYKTQGYDFYTDNGSGSTLDLMVGPVNWATDPLPREADVAIRTEVANTIKEFGLEKTEPSESLGTEVYKSFDDDVYMGKGLICTVPKPSAKTSSTYASCGRIDAYKETAAKTQPLASALPNAGRSTILNNLKITASKVSGYQKASMGTGGSISLLYKKNNDAWVYFKGSQALIACTDYSTQDLRNAFKGDACHDPNDQTATVQ